MKNKCKTLFVMLLVISFTVLPLQTALASTDGSYSFSSSYKSGRYYAALSKVKLTGDEVTDIVNIAKSQVGYHESCSSGNLSGYGSGSGNCTEYGRWYGSQNYWCNIFVSWCAYEAGVSPTVFPKLSGATCSYQSMLPAAGAKCFRFTSGSSLRPGDLTFCCTCSGGRNCIDHVGMVVSVDSSSIHTVEGNMSDAVTAVTYGASSGYSSHYNSQINFVARVQYSDHSASAADIDNAAAVTVSNGSIYALYDVALSFDDAEKVCKEMGGHLASISSKTEQKALTALSAKGKYGDYYIGLTSSPDGLRWNSGEKVGYSALNEKGASFPYTALSADGSWLSVPLRRSGTGFICEVPLSSLKAANTAVFGGHRYEVYDASLTYEEASAFALAKGGTLVKIDDALENEMISLLLKGSSQYYIGASGSENELMNLSYTAFNRNVNFLKKSYVVMKNDDSAAWDCSKNFSTGTATGFIVEYDAGSTSTLVYDAAGGTSSPVDQTAKTGKTVTLSGIAPTKKNKTFLGWATDKKAKKAIFQPDETVTLTQNTILYAVWG